MTDDAHDATPRAGQVMRMLEEGVPLSLLLDVFWWDVPDSREILEAEGLPEDRWWVSRRRDSA